MRDGANASGRVRRTLALRSHPSLRLQVRASSFHPKPHGHKSDKHRWKLCCDEEVDHAGQSDLQGEAISVFTPCIAVLNTTTPCYSKATYSGIPVYEMYVFDACYASWRR